jgi:hypothetical protein
MRLGEHNMQAVYRMHGCAACMLCACCVSMHAGFWSRDLEDEVAEADLALGGPGGPAEDDVVNGGVLEHDAHLRARLFVQASCLGGFSGFCGGTRLVGRCGYTPN